MSLVTRGMGAVGTLPSFGMGFSGAAAPVVVERTGGSVAKPFRRAAVTPLVHASVAATGASKYPAVVVPADPALKPAPRDVTPAPADRFAGHYVRADNVIELVRPVTLALPQFELAAVHALAAPEVGAELMSSPAAVASVGEVAPPAAASAVRLQHAASVAFRTVLPPVTVRNPTDEELVAIALKLI